MNLSVVILCAGKGARMHSVLPKVLHKIAGKPLLAWVLTMAKELQPQQLVLVDGYQGDTLRQHFAQIKH